MLVNRPNSGHDTCPQCGRHVAAVRMGVVLTRTLSLIFDRVKMAGEDGIEGHELRRYLEEKTGRVNVTRALPARVQELNAAIEKTGFSVRCHPDPLNDYKSGRKGSKWIYYLKRAT